MQEFWAFRPIPVTRDVPLIPCIHPERISFHDESPDWPDVKILLLATGLLLLYSDLIRVKSNNGHDRDGNLFGQGKFHLLPLGIQGVPKRQADFISEPGVLFIADHTLDSGFVSLCGILLNL